MHVLLYRGTGVLVVAEFHRLSLTVTQGLDAWTEQQQPCQSMYSLEGQAFSTPRYLPSDDC